MKLKMRTALIGFLFAVAGIYLLVTGIIDRQAYKQEPVDVYDTQLPAQIGELVGRRVTGELGYAVDICAEKTTSKKVFGITTSTKSDLLYYIVPIWDANNEMYFVTAAVSTAKSGEMDSLVEAFWSEDEGSASIDVDGVISKTNKEVAQFMKEWFTSDGYFTAAEAEKYCLPYTISIAAKDPINNVYVGIGALVLGIILMIVNVLIKKKEAANAAKTVVQGAADAVNVTAAATETASEEKKE